MSGYTWASAHFEIAVSVMDPTGDEVARVGYRVQPVRSDAWRVDWTTDNVVWLRAGIITQGDDRYDVFNAIDGHLGTGWNGLYEATMVLVEAHQEEYLEYTARRMEAGR